jgi:hypothetical protein
MSVFMLREDFDAIAISRKPPKLPVREVALNDLWMVFATFDGTATAFFDKQETERPFCFGPVAGEDESENPIFTEISKQAAYCAEHGDVETARELSKVGLKIGHVHPKKKTEPDAKSESNPYLPGFKGDRTKRIAELLKAPGGLKLVNDWADKAGCTIAGAPKQKIGAARFKK